MVKNPPANAGDLYSIPKSGRSHREGNGNSFQYSCLGNPTEEPGGLQSKGSKRIRHDWATEHTGVKVGFLGGSVVNNSPANADVDSIPGPGKIPWRRKWQSTPVFLPERFHGQRSLVSYSSWGHKNWTWLSTHTHFYFCCPSFGLGNYYQDQCYKPFFPYFLHGVL